MIILMTYFLVLLTPVDVAWIWCRLIADRFIVVRSNDPETSDAEQVTFPLSCQFMHTMHYRIYAG